VTKAKRTPNREAVINRIDVCVSRVYPGFTGLIHRCAVCKQMGTTLFRVS